MVKEGQKVAKGDALILLEAMKMEHVMRAPRDGTVTKIFHKVGDLVGEKKLLVDLTTDEE